MAELLPGQAEREFAVADAPGETFGEMRGGFLAIGRDEFREGGKQAGLRQAIAIDPLDAGLVPGLVQIAERSLLLFVFRSEPSEPAIACIVPPMLLAAMSPGRPSRRGET